MPHRPDLSIVIPCYNAAGMVGDALASIQGQTHRN